MTAAVRLLFVTLTVLVAAGALAHGQRDDRRAARPASARATSFRRSASTTCSPTSRPIPASRAVRSSARRRAKGTGRSRASRSARPARPRRSGRVSARVTTLTTSAESVSGRVSGAGDFAACELHGPCRLWVGTAGGGVWRTDDAMNTVDPGLALGVARPRHQQHRQPRARSDRSHAATRSTSARARRTRRTTPAPARDSTIGRRRRSLDARLDDDRRPGGRSGADRLHVHARHRRHRRSIPRNPQTIYIGTATAMLGMTAVRGGQAVTTGYPQPRVGLYKTENAGASWTLLWVPPLDPVIPFNPNLGVGARRHDVRRASRQARSAQRRPRSTRPRSTTRSTGRRRRSRAATRRSSRSSRSSAPALSRSGDVRSHRATAGRACTSTTAPRA